GRGLPIFQFLKKISFKKLNLRCCTIFSVRAPTMMHIPSPFYPCKQGRKKSRHFFRFGGKCQVGQSSCIAEDSRLL
ncbi:DNA-directed DNA polymerase, partial [Frankliniella fusca]